MQSREAFRKKGGMSLTSSMALAVTCSTVHQKPSLARCSLQSMPSAPVT